MRGSVADEIALREASLADARSEHAAGELDDAALARIEARELAALAALRAAAREEPPPPAPRRPRRHRRAWLALAGAAVAAAVVVTLLAALGPRQPGSSITGGLSLSPAQRVAQLLAAAQADVAAGHEVTALDAYAQVLARAPRNVVALTQTGWLDFSAGSAAKDAAAVAAGLALLRRAIAVAPRDPAPHLYLGIAAASTPGNAGPARTQLRLFEALHPSLAQRAIAAPYLRALGLPG
ncbi:MAG: hypothetical protein ACP5OV_07785 [Acidimicrobiales bacterium]